MAADNAPDKIPDKATSDFKRSAYDFCEKAAARFEQSQPPGQSFGVSRMQTISGDTLRRTYIFTFDVKVTGCELTD